MTDEELREALHGLFAHDMGARHLGVRDEELRARCKAELHMRRGSAGWPPWLARLTREMWLSEEAIADGYDAEEADLFLRWLPARMACPLQGAAMPEPAAAPAPS